MQKACHLLAPMTLAPTLTLPTLRSPPPQPSFPLSDSAPGPTFQSQMLLCQPKQTHLNRGCKRTHSLRQNKIEDQRSDRTTFLLLLQMRTEKKPGSLKKKIVIRQPSSKQKLPSLSISRIRSLLKRRSTSSEAKKKGAGGGEVNMEQKIWGFETPHQSIMLGIQISHRCQMCCVIPSHDVSQQFSPLHGAGMGMACT